MIDILKSYIDGENSQLILLGNLDIKINIQILVDSNAIVD